MTFRRPVARFRSDGKKFGNIRVEIDGYNFASKAEGNHYVHLKTLMRAGIITELECQPKFPLIVNGIKVCTYVADFKFRDHDGQIQIHDVKGMRTPVFSLKAKLFHALNPRMRITEIAA